MGADSITRCAAACCGPQAAVVRQSPRWHVQQMKATCATCLSYRNDTARAVYDSLIDCRANLKVRVAAARLLMWLCATSL